VAQGDQFGGAFGCLDCRDTRYAQDIAFFAGTRLDHAQGIRLHHDPSACTGEPVRLQFFSNIYHVRLALGIEMS
jgi:hypothetical protein